MEVVTVCPGDTVAVTIENKLLEFVGVKLNQVQIVYASKTELRVLVAGDLKVIIRLQSSSFVGKFFGRTVTLRTWM